jgi:hypothetical protein
MQREEKEMRPEITKTIEAARTGNQPVSQNLLSTLLVMGELLSQALDRLDKLEGGFLANPDVLSSKNVLK